MRLIGDMKPKCQFCPSQDIVCMMIIPKAFEAANYFDFVCQIVLLIREFVHNFLICSSVASGP